MVEYHKFVQRTDDGTAQARESADESRAVTRFELPKAASVDQPGNRPPHDAVATRNTLETTIGLVLLAEESLAWHDIAYFPGGEVRAGIDLAVDDQACADACAQRDTNHVTDAATGAAPTLAEREEVDLVLHDDRQAERLFQVLAEWEIAPAEHGRKDDDAPGELHDRRHTNADAAHRDAEFSRLVE